jgi:predicted GNAT family acetyltransferase
MGWTITDDLNAYVAAAGDFLRANTAENTVPLGVAATLREQGAYAFGEPLFGWWRPGADGVCGAFLQTGAYPAFLSDMPEQATLELATLLSKHHLALPGVNGDEKAAYAFAAEWERRTGTAGTVLLRQRLYRLEHLEMPPSMPDGTTRVAGADDHDLVLDWFTAFEAEAHSPASETATLVADRLGHRGVLLWEVDGVPMSLAARTRVVSAMARIGPVYTPPEHRCHGYGAAVTAALTKSALESGADEVVLFTDLANRTSNGIYRRLGYRAVRDRLVIVFGA